MSSSESSDSESEKEYEQAKNEHIKKKGLEENRSFPQIKPPGETLSEIIPRKVEEKEVTSSSGSSLTSSQSIQTQLMERMLHKEKKKNRVALKRGSGRTYSEMNFLKNIKQKKRMSIGGTEEGKQVSQVFSISSSISSKLKLQIQGRELQKKHESLRKKVQQYLVKIDQAMEYIEHQDRLRGQTIDDLQQAKKYHPQQVEYLLIILTQRQKTIQSMKDNIQKRNISLEQAIRQKAEVKKRLEQIQMLKSGRKTTKIKVRRVMRKDQRLNQFKQNSNSKEKKRKGLSK